MDYSKEIRRIMDKGINARIKGSEVVRQATITAAAAIKAREIVIKTSAAKSKVIPEEHMNSINSDVEKFLREFETEIDKEIDSMKTPV